MSTGSPQSPALDEVHRRAISTLHALWSVRSAVNVTFAEEAIGEKCLARPRLGRLGRKSVPRDPKQAGKNLLRGQFDMGVVFLVKNVKALGDFLGNETIRDRAQTAMSIWETACSLLYRLGVVLCPDRMCGMPVSAKTWCLVADSLWNHRDVDIDDDCWSRVVQQTESTLENVPFEKWRLDLDREFDVAGGEAEPQEETIQTDGNGDDAGRIEIDLRNNTVSVDQISSNVSPHHAHILDALVQAAHQGDWWVSGTTMNGLPGCRGKKISREIKHLKLAVPTLNSLIDSARGKGYRLTGR